MTSHTRASWNLLRRASLAVAAFVAVGAGSCADDEPVDEAAAGLARLTMASLGALAGAILDDEACGFAAEAVRDAGVVHGRPGERGRVAYAIDKCTLDFEANPQTVEDCTDEATTLTGKVTVTATLSLSGRVTGDADSPILPLGPDATTLRVSEAVLDGFTVELSDGTKLVMREGSISATLQPLLARDESSGLCTVATQDLSIRDVVYDNANLFIESTDEGSSHVFVSSSRIDAQVGRNGSEENSYRGMITIVGQEFELPGKAKSAALDPDYERTKFEARFACNEGLELPLSYECSGEDTDEQVAAGIAKFSIQALSVISEKLEEDERCGFASANSKANAEVDGPTGAVGSVTNRLDRCTLEFPEGTLALKDCDGDGTEVSGRVTVSGHKITQGILTGDTDQPVVPIADTPATVFFESVRVDDLFLTLGGDAAGATTAASLRLITGTMRGTVTPRLALGDSTNACSVPTPHARFSNVRHADIVAALDTDDGRVTVRVSDSNLNAVAGSMGGVTNALTGTITVDGRSFVLDPSDGLVPDFDLADLEAAWPRCADDLAVPISYECNPNGTFVDGAARLTTQTFGVLVGLVQADSDCGFSSAAVTGAPALVGDVGGEGEATFSIDQPCRLRFARARSAGVDCHDLETYARGGVTVTGTRRTRGYVAGDPTRPVVPTSRDATEYELTAVFDDFVVWTSTPGPTLTIESGTLHGTMRPRTALDQESGLCILPTPVTEFEGLAYEDAHVMLETEGRRIALDIDSSAIHAQAGTKGSVSNRIWGTVDADGVNYGLPVDGDPALDPDFDPATFDASYACTDNLVITSTDTECSFRQTLGLAAAKLAVQNLGIVGGLIAGNNTCGFASMPVLAAPVNVGGAAGGPGQITWATPPCVLEGPAAGPISVDCAGTSTFVSGTATATATQTAQGFRAQQCGPAGCLELVAPMRGGIETDVTMSSFADFATESVRLGRAQSEASIAFDGGSGSFHLEPILGENAQAPGSHDIQTPVFRMSAVVLTDVPATLRLGASRFDVQIDGADLDVAVGYYEGRGNEISGTITIDGELVDIPLSPLDPAYDQVVFDHSYACTPNLVATVPPN